MNAANKQRVRQAIADGAGILQENLPPSHRHPKGRNAHAHIAQVIQSMIGCSYTMAKDEDTEGILAIVEYIIENPF